MKIGFSANHNNWLSSMIMKVTCSKWSHAFLVKDYVPTEDDYVIIEAAAGGVQKGFLSKYQDSAHTLQVFGVEGTDFDYSAVSGLVGQKYGHIQLVGIVFAKLFKSTWNVFTKNTVCSEVVCRWLQASKYAELFKDLNPDYVSPEDLHRRLLQYPEIFKQEQV